MALDALSSFFYAENDNANSNFFFAERKQCVYGMQ